MKKIKKTAVIISTIMILMGILAFLLLFPFIYIYVGVLEEGNTGMRNTKWEKLSVKYSIFNFQKKHTLSYAVPSLYLSGEYETMLDYIHKLEKLGINEKNYDALASNAYLQLGDFGNALKYAQLSEQTVQLLKVYIKMNDLDNSKKMLAELFKGNHVRAFSYLYKAEVEIMEKNYSSAYKDINYVLKSHPKSVDAWKVKAEIAKSLGYKKEYSECIEQLANLEKNKNGKSN